MESAPPARCWISWIRNHQRPSTGSAETVLVVACRQNAESSLTSFTWVVPRIRKNQVAYADLCVTLFRRAWHFRRSMRDRRPAAGVALAPLDMGCIAQNQRHRRGDPMGSPLRREGRTRRGAPTKTRSLSSGRPKAGPGETQRAPPIFASLRLCGESFVCLRLHRSVSSVVKSSFVPLGMGPSLLDGPRLLLFDAALAVAGQSSCKATTGAVAWHRAGRHCWRPARPAIAQPCNAFIR
jgi:hypothetical protein